jgi:hypothetical protein
MTERLAGRGQHVVMALAFAGAALVLLYVGRDQIIRGDALYYAGRLGSQPFLHGIFHSPANKYLIAAPLVLYDGMFHAFGLGADLPYRLVSTALVLLCGWLFFVLARRRIGFAALVPTVLVLLLGTGWETVLTAIRIPSLLATAAGLGALAVLDRDRPNGPAWAAGLLSVAVLSHPGGLAYVAAAGVMVAFRARNGAWKKLLTIVPAIVIFGGWYLFVREPSTPSLATTTAADVLSFGAHSWVTLVADVTGLAMITAHPSYDQAINQVVAAAVLGIFAGVLVARHREVAPRAWGLLLALAIVLCSARLSPGGAFRAPDSTRYLHAEVVLFMLVMVEVVSLARPRLWALGAIAAVLGFGLIYNLDSLRAGGANARLNSQLALGAYSAYELAGPRGTTQKRETAIGTPPSDYRKAARAFGSVALPPDELAGAAPEIRQAADSALAHVLGLALVAHGSPPRAGGAAPDVAPTTWGRRAGARAGCVTVAPSSPAVPGTTPAIPTRPPFRGKHALQRVIEGRSLELPTVPPIAELRPHGSRLIVKGPLAGIAVLTGREFDPPTALLDHMGAGTVGTVDLPRLPDGRNWSVLVGSRAPVTVCGGGT